MRFANSDEHENIDIGGVIFRFRRITVRQKLQIVSALQRLNEEDLEQTFDHLKRELGRIIVDVEIDGKFVPFDEAAERLESFADVKAIMERTLRYCTLSEPQRKNSDSLPGQHSPASARNAVKPVEPDDAPAGTTRE